MYRKRGETPLLRYKALIRIQTATGTTGCYIRGNTHIGDNCHVGQSVEIKNSILMDKVSVGHLSYVGDSIIGERTNLGAGTTVANLRHDGKNHKSVINGEQINTGRHGFSRFLTTPKIIMNAWLLKKEFFFSQANQNRSLEAPALQLTVPANTFSFLIQ